MIIYIKLKSNNKFYFSPKSLDKDYIEISTELSISEILYFQEYLVYEENKIKIVENNLPEYKDTNIFIFNENNIDTVWAYPGIKGNVKRSPSVIPKDSILFKTKGIFTNHIRKHTEWIGNTLYVDSILKGIEIIKLGDFNYEYR